MFQMLTPEPVVGPLAFKTVRVRENPFRLCSPSFPMDWEPHKLAGPAKCQRSWQSLPGGTEIDHRAPLRACTCGIYGARDFHISDLYIRDHTDNLIILFEGQGRVVVHTGGFRAQYARVVAIIRRLPGKQLAADRLDAYQLWMYLAADYFGVPLVEHEEAQEAVNLNWDRYQSLLKFNAPA